MSSFPTSFSKTIVAIIVAVSLLVSASTVFLATAQQAHAFEWGGQFNTVIPCFNAVIWTNTSGPRGGNFIWTPSTRTYDYGPPSHSGQYGLGLAGPPYFCIVFPFPLVVFPGVIMTMVGTSQ